MTSNSSRPRERGSIVQALVFVGALVALQLVLVDMFIFRGRITYKKLQDSILSVQLNSGVEAMVLANRLAEIKYVQALSAAGCSTANPYGQALKLGSGCAAAGSVSIFSGSDLGTTAGLYTYGTGCTIGASSGCTASTAAPLVTVRPTGGDMPLGNATFQIFLVSANPAKEITEYLAIGTTPDGRTYKNGFAIRAIAPNLAHLESGDGRVVQENPDPLSKCAGTVWGSFSVWDPTASLCNSFAQLGGGTGLAYYNSRYFGFRPFDGQVIDLIGAGGGSGSSYMVQEDGTLSSGGAAIFPPHDRSLLANSDDITLIQDQIYSVAGGSGDGKILAFVSDGGGGFTSKMVCDLAALGWSQSYSGIAALSWGDPLYPAPTTSNDVRLATFLLKTDGGDMLTAEVIETSAGPTCYAFKDSNLQKIEYLRTVGFDRTDDQRSYYTY